MSADRVAISSGEGVLPGDSSQTQQQEIIADHGLHMSIGELLKAIKGANGMPVLFIPSGDGRLVAVAVDDIQNLVPANRNNESGEKKQQDIRAWLLLLTSLVATVSFTAGLTPPGGFWATDDKANGYVAGTSVMRDKFPTRYRLFQFGNKIAFFCSLMIIGMLARNINNKPTATALRNTICFPFVVALCIVGLVTTFITGTSYGLTDEIYTSVLVVLVIVYMSIPWVISWIFSTRSRARPPESLV